MKTTLISVVLSLGLTGLVWADNGPLSAESAPLARSSAPAATSAVASDYSYYRVQPGDSVATIARKYGSTPEVLQALNPDLASKRVDQFTYLLVPKILPGARLPKPKPAQSPAPASAKAASAQPAETAPAATSKPVARSVAPAELSDEEVDILYEQTVGKYWKRGSTVAVEGLPEHINTFVTADGTTLRVPAARPRPVPVKDDEGHRRTLSSRHGMRVHAVLRTALKFLAVPYVWGGESPDGFDCSGFVQRVFAMNGIHLPRTADIQFEVGRAVPRGKELPGDVVFFETYAPGASHVGIYLGKDQFVHASSRAAQVTISSLKEEFFTQHYLGAKRMW